MVLVMLVGLSILSYALSTVAGVAHGSQRQGSDSL